MKRFTSIWIAALLAVGFYACDPSRLIDMNKPVEPTGWYYQQKIPFDVQVTDTHLFYNVFVNLRISSDYKYNNMFMWVHTTNPQKQTDKRRIEIRLADERGKWLGSGLGDLYDYQFPVYTKIRFPQSGFYRFELEQNMRDDTLLYVKNAGIRIEKWQAEQ